VLVARLTAGIANRFSATLLLERNAGGASSMRFERRKPTLDEDGCSAGTGSRGSLNLVSIYQDLRRWVQTRAGDER
jgi:hypothetical protein